MNKFNFMAALVLGAVASGTANAAFVGDITGSGTFSDSVDTADGWVTNSPVIDGVDFWRLVIDEASTLSVDILSDLDFGISVYQGAVSDDIGFAFNNAADFTDPTTYEYGSFIAGTASYGEAGSSLLDIALSSAGEYTIAVGGDGFGFAGPYSYDMNVDVAPVPVPGGFGLAALGSALVVMMRRRKTR